MRRPTLLVALLLAATLASLAAAPAAHAVSFAPLPFANDAQRLRYRHLIDELRCPVCQNQTLAESDADLAHDLRTEVYNMVREGKSNKTILDFMVQRYGDFILYRPPFQPLTYALWLAPFLLAVLGVVVLLLYLRARAARTHRGTAPLDAEERERVRQLLSRTGS